jgi:hypothetical protein
LAAVAALSATAAVAFKHRLVGSPAVATKTAAAANTAWSGAVAYKQGVVESSIVSMHPAAATAAVLTSTMTTTETSSAYANAAVDDKLRLVKPPAVTTQTAVAEAAVTAAAAVAAATANVIAVDNVNNIFVVCNAVGVAVSGVAVVNDKATMTVDNGNGFFVGGNDFGGVVNDNVDDNGCFVGDYTIGVAVGVAVKNEAATNDTKVNFAAIDNVNGFSVGGNVVGAVVGPSLGENPRRRRFSRHECRHRIVDQQ